jgi:hypothetical protein
VIFACKREVYAEGTCTSHGYIARNFICRSLVGSPTTGACRNSTHSPRIYVHRVKNLNNFPCEVKFRACQSEWYCHGKHSAPSAKNVANDDPSRCSLVEILRRFNLNNSTRNSGVHIFKTRNVTQNIFKLNKNDLFVFVIHPPLTCKTSSKREKSPCRRISPRSLS